MKTKEKETQIIFIAAKVICQNVPVFCRIRFIIQDWLFKQWATCGLSHDTCSTFAQCPLFCLMGLFFRSFLLSFVSDCDSSIPNHILFHSKIHSAFLSRAQHRMCCCFRALVFDGDHLHMASSPAESAVRAADRDSPETEGQRTGAERPEEGDGRDEGRLAEFGFRLCVFCLNSNPKILTNHGNMFVCTAVCR